MIKTGGNDDDDDDSDNNNANNTLVTKQFVTITCFQKT